MRDSLGEVLLFSVRLMVGWDGMEFTLLWLLVQGKVIFS